MNSHSSTPTDSVIPHFHLDEVTSSRFSLGKGSYCDVVPVTNVLCKDDEHNNDNSETREKNIDQLFEARRRLARRFLEQQEQQKARINQDISGAYVPQVRYALKRLRDDLSKEDLHRGKLDLKTEARILTQVEYHPNIISLHGIGISEGASLAAQEVDNVEFIVVDRLRSTLRNRMYKWRERRGVGLLETLGMDGGDGRQLWLECMIALQDIASAMNHLHTRGIIYRDLKPDNVGFDDDGVLKLFDFGLARTIPKQPAAKTQEVETTTTSRVTHSGAATFYETYKMTGQTGSYRYMAPEVAQSKPYGFPADVYSFAMVIYEVLSLKRPPAPQQRQGSELLARPIVPEKWPIKIASLIESMWEEDPDKRPTSQTVLEALQSLLRGPEVDLFPGAVAKQSESSTAVATTLNCAAAASGWTSLFAAMGRQQR